MKYQNLFLGKFKKNIINMLSAELAQSGKVFEYLLSFRHHSERRFLLGILFYSI